LFSQELHIQDERVKYLQTQPCREKSVPTEMKKWEYKKKLDMIKNEIEKQTGKVLKKSFILINISASYSNFIIERIKCCNQNCTTRLSQVTAKKEGCKL
jgi:hypothetical protein